MSSLPRLPIEAPGRPGRRPCGLVASWAKAWVIWIGKYRDRLQAMDSLVGKHQA